MTEVSTRKKRAVRKKRSAGRELLWVAVNEAMGNLRITLPLSSLAGLNQRDNCTDGLV